MWRNSLSPPWHPGQRATEAPGTTDCVTKSPFTPRQSHPPGVLYWLSVVVGFLTDAVSNNVEVGVARLLLLFIVMAGSYLFYPLRDLYIRDDPFSHSYRVVETGFWNLESCQAAGRAEKAVDFHCRKRTHFAMLTNQSQKYVQGSSGND